MSESFSTPKFASPPSTLKRRCPAALSPLVASVRLLCDNDDEEERRQRRRSKLMTNNLMSPGAHQASPARQHPGDTEKRKSVNLSHLGMSNAQIKEHYANCIKLSSENKINAKNAFGLHLIDYMKDLLKQSQKEDSSTNFQVASCTLDAGVKIYAYRVDSVHSDAYKVLGSLGRAVDNPDPAEENEVAGVDSQEANQTQATKKPKKKAAGKTIETNLKNINCDQFDLDFEVDPFFQKTSSGVDDGGTSGLLSLQLRSRSDKNDLLMDSSAKVNETCSSGGASDENSMVDLTGFKDLVQSFDSLEICSAFSSFKFVGWDSTSKDVVGDVKLPEDSADDKHRFDQNAPVEADPMESFDAGGGGDGFGSDDDGDGVRGKGLANQSGIGSVLFDAKEAQMSDGASRAAFPIAGDGALELSLQPSDYSYFSDAVLSAWAGPNHWKIKRNKDKLGSSVDSSRKSAKQKALFRVNFDEEIDLKKHMSTGRGATHLKEQTLEKLVVQMTILPEDMHYKVESFFELCLKPDVKVKRQQNAPSSLKEEAEGDWYNYDNPNDRENFIPHLTNDQDDDDYDGADSPDEVTFRDGARDVTQNLFAACDGSVFGGEGLVAQPNKVRVLDIGYAKQAKRIDVKKLKSAMWNLMIKKSPNEQQANMEANVRPVPGIEEEKSEKLSGRCDFLSMYKGLPEKISPNMAKNLSCPIAFVCLLYLANEKNLKLQGADDFSNVYISDGS